MNEARNITSHNNLAFYDLMLKHSHQIIKQSGVTYIKGKNDCKSTTVHLSMQHSVSDSEV